MESFFDHLRDAINGAVRTRGIAVLAAAFALILVVLLAFAAGEAVGYHRARFAHDLDASYGRDFGPGMRFGFPSPMMPDAHGAFGTIVSSTAAGITLAQPAGPEVQVNVATDTIIRAQDQQVTRAALVPGAYVVVFGEPAQGALDARLIRLVPPPAGSASTSSAF